MTTLYAILNWSEDRISNVKKLTSKFSNKPLVVATRFAKEYKTNTIELTTENVAASKNKILKYAQEKKVDYCFIIEDDMEVNDLFAFDLYIGLMRKYKLGFTMYGYGNSVNKVLENRPNPALMLKVSNSETVYITRFCCSSIMGFRISDSVLLFNEEMHGLETENLCKTASEFKQIPFNGFFFDISESWKYFSRFQSKTSRIKDNTLMQQDLTKIGGPISLERNADLLIEYIKDCNKGEK
jgi:hypothetical protein